MGGGFDRHDDRLWVGFGTTAYRRSWLKPDRPLSAQLCIRLWPVRAHRGHSAALVVCPEADIHVRTLDGWGGWAEVAS